MLAMDMEPADTPMLSETELREQYADLQRRALNLGSRGRLRIDQLAAAMQLLPKKHADDYLRVLKDATDDAMAAVLSYHRALPFLETANSLIESLAKPSPSAEDEEWREQLLFRLAEVLDTGASLNLEGEAHLERCARVDI
jgi:dsDNA-binding SOS-regulon protein